MTAVFAQNPGLNLGTSASVLQDIVSQNQAEMGAPGAHKPSQYTLKVSTGELMDVRVQDFYFQGGQLSMTGEALGSGNSAFIMKGDDANLYGWLVLHDKNIAFEYTTDASGQVQVNRVPVTKIFPVCNLDPAPNQMGPEPAGMDIPEIPADTAIPHIGAYDGVSDVNKLQSLPGAPKTLYINITAIQSKPKAELYLLWQSQAAAFSAFQINVTTDPAVYAAAGVTNSGTSKFINQGGRSACGMNSFGTTSACNLYLDGAGNGYSMGRTTVHETGHQMGLDHDRGSPGGEYFNGLPSFAWVPIMGNYWPGDSWGAEALYQWSKGEYSSATNKEDDLKIISGKVQFKPDDFPGTAPLKVEGTKVSGQLNRGRIGPNDEDVFSFRVATAGRANLKVSRIEFMGGAMLDIDAKILDAAGKVVVQNNKPKARGATLDAPVTPGDYTLVIKGGAEGAPENGFSSYSSIGFYSIEGDISGGVAVEKPRSPMDRAISVFTNPANTALNLKIPRDANVSKIALTSIGGQAVFVSQRREESINLSGLARGYYLLHIVADGESIQRRISRM